MMTRAEAIELAKQLGHEIKTVKAFDALLEALGLQLAIVNATGAWAVINPANPDVSLAEVA